MKKNIDKGRSLLRDLMPFTLGVILTQSILVADGKDFIRAVLVSILSAAIGFIIISILRKYDKGDDA